MTGKPAKTTSASGAASAPARPAGPTAGSSAEGTARTTSGASAAHAAATLRKPTDSAATKDRSATIASKAAEPVGMAPAQATTEILDCIGLLCPLPVLRARKRLLSLPSGSILAVQASDPMAAIDLPHFCAETGHDFLDASESAGFTTYRLRRR